VVIQLVTPAPLRINNGNRITALRWAAIFKQLGHRVRITARYDERPCDLLVALHARRSAASIRRFHELHPERPLVVVLTGTDLYRDIRHDAEAQRSLEIATRLIVLQSMALRELPVRLRRKTAVIYQSAEPAKRARRRANENFQVCVVAHLRPEKDPLRAAFAVRRLPPTSRIRVTHIGVALDASLGARARLEAARNRRYRWVGQLSHEQTRQALAESQLVSITSKMEGSSNVLSEALASKVPVVASKIDGLVGTLGHRYAGFFPVGDTEKLRALLLRAEADGSFYRRLQRQCLQLAKVVRPERELSAWRAVLRPFRNQRIPMDGSSAHLARASRISPRGATDRRATRARKSKRSNRRSRISPPPSH
jgi:putative glycosyltransferase (TIGR04348 family)